ncbi:hypothetical protein FKM82_008509 [Ascaphus truei]
MWGIPALLLLSIVMWVLLGAQGFPSEEGRLGEQNCALLSSQDRRTLHQATDGKELVISTWDSRRQLVSCYVDRDEEAVTSFLSRCRVEREKREAPGDNWFSEARLACQLFHRAAPSGAQSHNRDITASTEQQLHRVKRGFTYPGTLWCGAGNNADTYEDLGEHKETDACCRVHDHCAHVIHPFTSNYGYRSFRWHTISHCQCDSQFKQCLRGVNDTTSRAVGQAFFNVIQVPCFDFTYKEQCVERFWYGWCKKYNTSTVAVPRDSGLYDYGGELIDQDPKTSEDREPTPIPAVEQSSEQPTLGQVMQATEDLLKLMLTVSPRTTSDVSKVESATKKQKGKKERKHKKGKGLKGKRKEKLQSEDVRSSAKDIWVERGLPDNQLMDTILDLRRKQDAFNDVLNDEPIRNVVATPNTHITPVTSSQEFRSVTQFLGLAKKHTERPQKNRKERKGRRQRKKKPETESSVSDNLGNKSHSRPS